MTPEQRELVEATAERVVELLEPRLADLAEQLTARPGEESTARLVDAAGLADILGVSRDYVYEHAAELGALQLSDSGRARLRFDVPIARAVLAKRHPGPDDAAADPPPPSRAERSRRSRPDRVPLLPVIPSAPEVRAPERRLDESTQEVQVTQAQNKAPNPQAPDRSSHENERGVRGLAR